MQGATSDVGDRFRSMAGVLAVAHDDVEPPAGTPDALRMRGPDDEEWRPLLLAAGDK